MIKIIDYGIGNNVSMLNILNKVGGRGGLVTDPDAIIGADKIILPGVGLFDAPASATL